ncbi:mucin-binding protein, partial [Lacticaseibacillus camelliae]
MATAQSGYAAVTSPTIAGYTPDQINVPAVKLGTGTKGELKNVRVVVTYHPAAATLTVTYVDDVTGQTVTTAQVDGKTGDTGDYTVKVPEGGYVLAKNQAATVHYTLTPDDTDNFTVHLTHGISHEVIPTTRQITYQFADGGIAAQPKTQTVFWNISTDDVTGSTLATAQSDYDAVTSPTVAGYTPDQTVIPAVAISTGTKADLKNTKVVVTYQPDMQQIHVQYVDDDNNEAQVGTSGTLAGRTGTSTNWAATVPAGYTLAPGQAATGSYTFKATDNPDVTIHLVHAKKTATVTTTYTVNYAGLPSSLLPNSVAHSVDWTATTDEATGKTSYVPAANIVAGVNSPSIPGYTPDQTETPTIALTTMTQTPTDVTTTVTYHPASATLKVTYVDDVTGETVTTDHVNGVTGGTGDYQVNVPAGGYVLAKNQASTLTYTLTPDETDDLIVHITHNVTHTTATTTRTITYVVGGDSEKTPAPKTQRVTWNIVTDQVMGISVATPQGGYAEVISPEIPGYTPDVAVVTQQGLGAQAIKNVSDLKNDQVTVTYSTTADELQVTYVVHGEFGAPDQVIKTEMLTGKVGDKSTYTPVVPTGYEAANFTPGLPIHYTLTPWADGITLYLYQDYGSGTPGGDKNPGGGTNPGGDKNPGGGTNPG